MGKKKKEIKIIKNDSNKEDYTFVSDDILNNVKDNKSTNNEKKPENKLMRELKKRFIKRK